MEKEYLSKYPCKWPEPTPLPNTDSMDHHFFNAKKFEEKKGMCKDYHYKFSHNPYCSHADPMEKWVYERRAFDECIQHREFNDKCWQCRQHRLSTTPVKITIQK